MALPDTGATRLGHWYGALVAVSALLLLITLLSYALIGHGLLSKLLFWVGLGGENNIGAWWSGMLLVLAAFFAFDGFVDADKPQREQRGWLALGFALLLLSFDEIASLHEFLLDSSRMALAGLGTVGLALAGYGLVQLRRAGVPARVLARLLLAFGLLATVPVHEQVQSVLEWPNPVVYGVRAALEEGTEIIAMLIFVSVAYANPASLLRKSRDLFVALVHWRRLITLIAWALWLPLTAATFALPQPGGPADWLAATLFLMCALLATRAAVLGGKLDWRSMALVLFYLAASAAANAVSFQWDPMLLGGQVSVRGLVFALLLVCAVVILRANQRRMNGARALLIAAVIAASAFVWPTSQILWCGLPPALSLWLYLIESQAAAHTATVSDDVATALPPAVRV